MSGLRIVLQRLVRRFTIRKPCWICDKCGWRERHEAEVWCWKCGKSRGGQMLYTPNTNSDKLAIGQWFRLSHDDGRNAWEITTLTDDVVVLHRDGIRLNVDRVEFTRSDFKATVANGSSVLMVTFPK